MWKGVIFILLSTPLSPQCPASWGYSDREWGQWDRHCSLLATPSRTGAEWGGPGVQGNKQKQQQLPQVWQVGLILWRYTKEKNMDADKSR